MLQSDKDSLGKKQETIFLQNDKNKLSKSLIDSTKHAFEQ